MSKIRTFIAIEIDEPIREKIAALQNELKKTNEPVRWVNPKNIHLTLKFLGEVDVAIIESISECINDVAENFSSFSFAVKGVGVFPNFKRPRVLWTGIENGSGELVKMAGEISEQLNELGFAKERRPFKTHLTMARVKSRLSTKFLEKIKGFEFDGGEVIANEIVIMRSELKSAGAVYSPFKKSVLISIF